PRAYGEYMGTMQQIQKPGAIAAAVLGAIPRINFGEVKNVRSYAKALRQLAGREGRGNSALALYDDRGNVHLQVFQPQPGAVCLKWCSIAPSVECRYRVPGPALQSRRGRRHSAMRSSRKCWI